MDPPPMTREERIKRIKRLRRLHEQRQQRAVEPVSDVSITQDIQAMFARPEIADQQLAEPVDVVRARRLERRAAERAADRRIVTPPQGEQQARRVPSLSGLTVLRLNAGYLDVLASLGTETSTSEFEDKIALLRAAKQGSGETQLEALGKTSIHAVRQAYVTWPEVHMTAEAALEAADERLADLQADVADAQYDSIVDDRGTEWDAERLASARTFVRAVKDANGNLIGYRPAVTRAWAEAQPVASALVVGDPDVVDRMLAPRPGRVSGGVPTLNAAQEFSLRDLIRESGQDFTYGGFQLSSHEFAAMVPDMLVPVVTAQFTDPDTGF